MKTIIITLSFIVLEATSVAASRPDIDAEWEAFKMTYNKVFFKSLTEEAYRKSVFTKTFADVEEHNKRFDAGFETYEKGINEFSDLTWEEFADNYLENELSFPPMEDVTEVQLKRVSTPKSYNWYTPNIPVKTQLRCGSCWAFASVGALEYQFHIKRRDSSKRFSEQELLDCVSPYNNCNGGRPIDAIAYMKRNGLQLASVYPYKGVKGKCLARNNAKPKKAVIGVGKSFPSEESYKDHLYQHGPIVAPFFADRNFKDYKRGIFNNVACNRPNKNINHAIVLLGYGSENGKDYWLVRNSWGAKWGNHGHFKIARNKKMCNLGMHHAHYPIVSRE